MVAMVSVSQQAVNEYQDWDHAVIQISLNHDLSVSQASATPVSGISLPDDTLLTSLYNSELILRQKEMHLFLKRFLQLYSSSCIDGFPRELLQGLENISLEKVLFESSGKVSF